MITGFLDDRRARNLSQSSIKFYSGYLNVFLKQVTKPILRVTKEDITGFLATLTCGPGGKHAYYRVIRAFYKWAAEQDYVSSSPTDRMKSPKVPRPLRYAVSLQDLETLLGACDGVRDQLIVSMLADTGLRRSELANINLSDLDAELQILRVWGKGAKQRVVRFGPRTHSLVLVWLQQQPLDGRLLNLNTWGIAQMLRRLEKRTGIKCNAHAFRRTFACESVRNGLNLFYVQSLLGHSTLTMTRVYAEQVNSEDAIKAYKPIVT